MVALILALVPLVGCAGFRVHDASRAAESAAIKEQYAEFAPSKAIATERENVARLLAAELQAVDDNRKVDRDFALLSLANDRTPMGAAVDDALADRLEDLGVSGARSLRLHLENLVDIEIAHRELSQRAVQIERLIGASPGACSPASAPAEELEVPGGTDSTAANRAKNNYERWKASCETLRAENRVGGGEIDSRRDRWQKAVLRLAKDQEKQEEIQGELREARREYNAAAKALADASGKGEALQNDLTDKATTLKALIAAAADLGLTGERVDAITTVLTAAATSNPGKVPKNDPNVMLAAKIAAEIPSLAGSMTQLIEDAKAPSVSGLLIEMRHQTILAQQQKLQIELREEEIAILRASYKATIDEARQLLEFSDAVCSYAMVSGGKRWPGAGCDTFEFDASSKKCRAGATEPVSNCVLAKTWRENLKTAKDEARRELYRALAAYLQALSLQAEPYKLNFKLVDVEHRRTLLARESAIRSWDNLVGIPINQIDAYYQAGLTPQEIADILVKAFAATAIAIGLAL
jgi:hypothetical protein